MKVCANLVFLADHSSNIFRALKPELDNKLVRSKVWLEFGHSYIRLKIDSDDLVSIRAALNTWIRLVKIAIEIENI